MLLAVAACVLAQAQQAICVHGQQGCQLFDIQNIEEMGVCHDTLSANVAALQLAVPFDSISFSDASVTGMRVGWWGDLAEGPSSCYYWPDSTNIPNVKMTAEGGLSTSVLALVRHDRSQNPRRVGRKWRYTTGTLTGRHRFRLSCFDASCYEHYTMCELDDVDDRSLFNMSQMFMGKPSRVVSRSLNYWHLPSAVTTMPSEPLFGHFDGQHYELPLVDDSLTVLVDLSLNYDGTVMCDTMKLVFASDTMACEAIKQLELTGGDDISLFYYSDTIYIIEQFTATIDEVKRWLVRFDLDLYKPLFLRDDE